MTLKVRREESVSEGLHPFGVATDWGMGRTPLNDVTSILKISKEVAAPF